MPDHLKSRIAYEPDGGHSLSLPESEYIPIAPIAAADLPVYVQVPNEDVLTVDQRPSADSLRLNVKTHSAFVSDSFTQTAQAGNFATVEAKASSKLLVVDHMAWTSTNPNKYIRLRWAAGFRITVTVTDSKFGLDFKLASLAALCDVGHANATVSTETYGIPKSSVRSIPAAGHLTYDWYKNFQAWLTEQGDVALSDPKVALSPCIIGISLIDTPPAVELITQVRIRGIAAVKDRLTLEGAAARLAPELRSSRLLEHFKSAYSEFAEAIPNVKPTRTQASAARKRLAELTSSE